ncbi:hypothetical protein [Cellulomonas cellasea]|uniref:Uncharacterized protein n=2 Tax=Cellulomonas cellasea TaxID=43670 RepID=A0A0A0BDW0_9CELL|nr:hypothetical protein [Cellulomonas cellasea]KGM03476.1 hypothetical protein Q760_03330 [Cellulomonas cellasea DSM 20118]GEA88939.1 hypothetical protein CCE01nite_28880 [Cellulomonas cellasea]
MTRRTTLGAVAGVLALGALAAARSRSGAVPDRWHVVTIHRDPADVDVTAAGRPRPLAELGEAVELRVSVAPGDRGTELAARVRPDSGLSGSDARDLDEHVRRALRDTRCLLETGEVLRPDDLGTSRATLTNFPLRLALRKAKTGGRL